MEEIEKFKAILPLSGKVINSKKAFLDDLIKKEEQLWMCGTFILEYNKKELFALLICF